jgi:hypothetical protein
MPVLLLGKLMMGEINMATVQLATKQQRFISEVAKGKSNSQAAIDAGFSCQPPLA